MNPAVEYTDINELVHSDNVSKTNHLRVKEQDGLYIIRYNKEALNYNNYEKLYKFRSVITDGKKIYSVAPTKSQDMRTFMEQNSFEECVIEEFLEGTMINCFYHENEWKLATRSKIHANCKFSSSSKKTFAEMFNEAMLKLTFCDLNKQYMYSFVLQHPDNRIVVAFEKPNIALVEVKKYNGNSMTILDIHTEEFEYLRDKVTFPKILHYYNSWNNLLQSVTHPDVHYTVLGCMIKNKKTAKRAKIRNPNYEKVRRLKGNHSKIQFQYYSLRKLGKVREYLYYFSEHKQIFQEMQDDIHKWTFQLSNHYVNCYIKKTERNLKSYPFQYRIHMYNLHKIYIQELRQLRQSVSKSIVIDYVNRLEPAALMYVINYHHRL